VPSSRYDYNPVAARFPPAFVVVSAYTFVVVSAYTFVAASAYN
jgi:hypothetical protein